MVKRVLERKRPVHDATPLTGNKHVDDNSEEHVEQHEDHDE